MEFIKTGILSKLEKDNKIYLPLAIRKELTVEPNDEIEYCLGPENEIFIKKFTDVI